MAAAPLTARAGLDGRMGSDRHRTDARQAGLGCAAVVCFLKSICENLEYEPLPDRIVELLAQLDQATEGDQNDDNS